MLLDTRPGNAWAQGHFEGALDADLDRVLSTAADAGFDPTPDGRHPLPSLERWTAQLGQWGITPDTPVVAYDGVKGELGACRLWWMLKAVGHGPVGILEGGRDAGLARGWKWTDAPSPVPEPVPPYPATRWLLPTIGLEEAAAYAADPERVLLDVRSPERWRGEVEPLDPVPGRIPGSVNVFLANNLGHDGRFKTAEQLRALYLPLFDGRDASQVAVHCGSGVSACATLYALDKAGLHGAALYVGSYSQWVRSGRALGKGA